MNDDNQENNGVKETTAKRQGRFGYGQIFLIALVGGVLGGGIAFGGYQYYQNNSATVENSKGTTKVSNVKVNVSTQSTKAFNKIKNAVVSVEAYSESSSSSSLEGLFGSDSSSGTTESESEGSGVIYKKTGNTAFVVTNNHVISGADKVEILLNSGKKLKATVVGHDSITDLAVLKINAQYVKQVASFGNSNNIQVGQTALAIGSPLGSTYATSLTQGIISAKKRTIDTTDSSGMTTGQTTVIQTDAAINPGNSGGPLINLEGQVVGINSMKLASTASSSSTSSSTSVEGMGFAIPSNEVVKIINELVKNGKISRPALGISLVDLSYISSSDQKSVLKLPTSVTGGVVVLKVSSSSPAKNAGLEKYDVITSLGGKKVKGLASLREALYEHKVGDTVQIQYYHDGSLKTANVKLTLEATDKNTTTSSDSGN
ncbi:MAG: trypsin-like peptidase domain-containing protein [Liquorilactobacillus nagelii]|jgi:serine protease Do|uniref:S1C family serine protease n=1 Tax=Liquorilactobacillus nagelii TaxID=82688 RepID=UPI0024301A36|nr:trypsin-like peptidase domain-containing protein [Liquorilactobacillus nagelii]MCI1921564.1 trypsin-like peptidase domain-containing protein [Liquorilactobacillus nagelii]MCI1977054.1 trypsin-like peptidase domain-containing protein [Liquorilactobacillus nagelii]